MSLIYRSGIPYLYRSKRQNGRVTSEYVARGETAVLIAEIDAVDRERRDLERREAQEERRTADERDARLDEIAKQARALARDTLERAGFHEHKGQWRRRRVRPRNPDRRDSARESHPGDGAADAR